MARILIAPFSRLLDNGKPNPKNWPLWAGLVAQLRAAGHDLEQCGSDHETDVCGKRIGLIPQDKVAEVIGAYDLCLCVDTWLAHAAALIGKPAVVIWTCTDPAIYAHAGNINVIAAAPRYAKSQYARMEDIAAQEPGQFPGPTEAQVADAVALALKEHTP